MASGGKLHPQQSTVGYLCLYVPGIFLIGGTFQSPDLNAFPKFELLKTLLLMSRPWDPTSIRVKQQFASFTPSKFIEWKLLYFKDLAFGGHLMRQCFLSLLPMQLVILQISLKSSAIPSHISEVGTVIYIYIGFSTFQTALSDSRTMPSTVFFPTRKKCPKDSQKCKDKWQNLGSTYMRERRKSKEKISWSGATVRGKWSFYGVMNFLEYYLQRRTM